MRERRPSNVEDSDDSDDQSSPVDGEGTRGTRGGSGGKMERQVSASRNSEKSSERLSSKYAAGSSWNSDNGAGSGKGLLAGDGASSPETKAGSSKTRPLRRPRLRSAWYCGLPVLAVTILSIIVVGIVLESFNFKQCESKGCRMCYMWPSYARLDDFDTEHTRFASKYSVWLYREGNVDDTSRDALVRPGGAPVLFIPGNAGSYKQARPIAAEAAHMFAAQAKANQSIFEDGARSLDFFTVDFNEDITAFHGQTLLDQAEYLNDAIAYILSLYHDARKTTKDSDLPDPASVIIIGHSMGGIVARTMLTMPNYQSNSINTIVTMSAPHARPPITVDADIVKTYERINHYWRKAYSAKWAPHNPLWHVTMISIAGGGLDTVVPNDYMSISSLVPETHGFTVFTSSVPGVWTGMDHQSILWCDQFRKVVAGALLEIVDVRRPGQTKPRMGRMKVFKKRFLTGMEPIAERDIREGALTSLLTLEQNSHTMVPLGETLEIRNLGKDHTPRTYLMPVPSKIGPRGTVRFTFLSDRKLDSTDSDAKLEVFLCSTFPLQAGKSSELLAMNMDMSGDSDGSSRLACKNAVPDVISLPASTQRSRHPYEETDPFSYLQYDLEDISDYEFAAIVDKSTRPTQGWAIAQFADHTQYSTWANSSFTNLLTNGVEMVLPVDRPMVTELHIPNMKSSLLAYKLSLGVQACEDDGQLFTPMIRQYISDPYESKFFVNVHQADINIHGMAPYMPEPLMRPLSGSEHGGVSLQLWSDSTCNTPIELSLQVDVRGSLGKLVLRYRTILAAFPLLIVALVLRRQFYEYDVHGSFIPFNEGLEKVLVETLPTVVIIVSSISFALSYASSTRHDGMFTFLWQKTKTTVDSYPILESLKNDMLIGSTDPFFWFLAPLFVIVSVGVCAIINYIVLFLIHSLTGVCVWFSGRPSWISNERRRIGPLPAFSTSSPRRRLFTTLTLLLFVATIIPYQFAYMVACIVQIVICIRALKFARETGFGSRANIQWDFSNYAHSIFLLMLWVLPINMSVLVVWVHNLAVHWLTPFSSHHNVLSVMPFILLVETLTSGSMIPRCENGLRYVTSILFLVIGVYSIMYGVMYAYFLHHVVNITAAWLVLLHFSTAKFSLSNLTEFWDPPDEPKKIP